jgi:hypothetical protein
MALSTERGPSSWCGRPVALALFRSQLGAVPVSDGVTAMR